jgi:hypothetical protein
MRETAFARLFVLGAHMIPDVDSGDWSFVILMDDESQAVVKNEFFVWDVDVGRIYQA